MTTLPFLVVGDCAELGCVEPQPTIGDRGTYLPTVTILIFMLPNYQARSPFVLKHTTSMYICIYVCMYGLYVCPLNARAGNVFS